ncbi:MAG: hypothetical protein H7282_01945 [Cytophagaceae bacterium]|nr:hypothetical protein [Cytophagaceae bacterium]
MNKNLKTLTLVAILLAGSVACKKSDDPAPSGGSSSGTTALKDSIYGNVTLTADKKYELQNTVYVPSGSVLTIEPGTVITGKSQTALVIEPGAKIIAIGTPSKPIIFTSAAPAGLRARGNWGGLVLAGKAKVNSYVASSPVCEGGIRTKYGSPNSAAASVDQDNSGTLQYVRVEWAGYAPIPGSELNGITFAGVGNGTTLDYVQTSYANDDGMEWFGGSVNGKHLINFAAIDDDFDTDNGFSGCIQFGLGLRAQYEADQSGSKGFESDNDGSASTNLPLTTCQFSNMTIVGPVQAMADNAIPGSYPGNAGKPGKFAANYIAGAHLRRNSAMSIYNSVISGWNNGILIDSKAGSSGVTCANIIAGTSKMQNNIVAGISKNFATTIGGADSRKYDAISVLNGAGDQTQTLAANLDSTSLSWPAGTTGPNTWFYSAGNSNRYQIDFANLYTNPVQTAWGFMGAPNNFNFVPKSGSPALTGASFSNATNPFFQSTNYVGAFGGTDWTATWAEFNPLNAAY